MSTLKFNTWLNTDNTENYKCRAWVNFNGTGTIAIRASGNVSSITDNGTGDYTVNFATAMSDANYSAITSWGNNASGDAWGFQGAFTILNSSYRFKTRTTDSSPYDGPSISVAIFR